MKILVVDDSAMVRIVIRKELEAGGLEVHEAVDGIDAINKLISIGNIDLVTLDIDMPKLNGYETCRRLRDEKYAKLFQTGGSILPVIFITGDDAAEGRLKGFEAGASDFFVQPFLSGELLDAVNRILRPDKRFEGLMGLVVDDDRVPRMVITPCLRQLGVTVCEAENGKAALDIVRAHPDAIDLVVTDLEMPEMKGDELCYRIRKDLGLKEVPIILLSGMPDKSVVLELLKKGATDYIVKPFIKEEFVARLTVHLETRLQNRMLRSNLLELNKLNKMKDDFLAVCSHDLRAPLNAILGCADLLLAADSINEEQKGFLTDIRGSGELLLSLISDLLDVSRIQSPNTEPNMTPISLVTAAKSSINRMRHNAVGKGVKLELVNNCADPLISGDPNSLDRAFTNLLSNAIKFTPDGGTVKLSIDPTGGREVAVCVTDTGIGISEDKIPRLFDKFSAATRPGTAGEQGTGLGLAIARDLVEKHAGTLEVTSQPGKGTCFKIIFPTIAESQST